MTAIAGANYLDENLAGILVIDEFFFGRCFDWSKTPEGREYWEYHHRAELFFANDYICNESIITQVLLVRTHYD